MPVHNSGIYGFYSALLAATRTPAEAVSSLVRIVAGIV